MHPKFLKYAQRFSSNKSEQLQINSFFTTLGDRFEEHLPYLYDIETACTRIIYALKSHEKICIYSDYDTDAVTATAVMYWGLVILGFSPENIDFYAPDRFTEGYGMNTEAIEKLCEKYKLIISVDCGINSVLEADVCKKKGVDLIITDHHHLANQIPDALGVINPRLSKIYNSGESGKSSAISPRYKLKLNYLSSSVTGVGVAWFVILWLGYFLKQETNLTTNFEIKDLNQLLGFVAIGTIADCQSILDETNRLLVKSGLKILQHLCTQSHPNQILYGLRLLLDQSGLSKQVQNGYKIVSSDLGFSLSPILNSSGRLSHASHSIQVLLAGNLEDKSQAQNLVSSLIATNNQRKLEVSRILSEVEGEAKIQFESGKKIIWVASSDWSKGLIGLLASRLVNQYELPVIVVELPEPTTDHLNQLNICTASLRAPENYSLPLAMGVSPHLFEKFGGHPGAAGFSAKTENLSQIQSLLEVELAKQIENITSASKTDYSEGLSDKYCTEFIDLGETQKNKLARLALKINTLWIEDFNEILDTEFWKSLLELEPFGQDFLYPLLVSPFKIATYTTMSENKHLKFELENFSLIWFNYAKAGFDLSQLQQGRSVIVVGRASQNAFNNKLNWQIIVEDLIFID